MNHDILLLQYQEEAIYQKSEEKYEDNGDFESEKIQQQQ